MASYLRAARSSTSCAAVRCAVYLLCIILMGPQRQEGCGSGHLQAPPHGVSGFEGGAKNSWLPFRGGLRPPDPPLGGGAPQTPLPQLSARRGAERSAAVSRTPFMYLGNRILIEYWSIADLVP
jgi:hypothetical protein